MLASGSVDCKVKLWDLRTKQSVHTLKAASKPILEVKLSGSYSGTYNDLFLVSSSQESTVRTWDFRSGRQISQLKSGHSKVQNLAINVKQKTLMSGHGDRHLRFWDLDKSKLVGTTPCEANPCQNLLCFEDIVFSGSSDGIKLFNISNFEMLDIIMKPASQIFDMKVKTGEALIVAEYSNVSKSVILS